MTTSAASTPSAIPPTGIPPQTAQRAMAYLRRAIEKMKSLQAAERVMVTLERVMLNRVPGKFDLSLLVAAINELNVALRGTDEDKVREAVFTVSQELEAVFESLVARDEAVMPYHLRRFCEDDTTVLDLNSLAALTSFYRALPHTVANRGKYDFVVTRLFSSADPGRSARHRHLRISREQLTKRLTEMCSAWGEVIVRDPADIPRINQIIQQFDLFITEARQISQFQELVSQTFFQRIRDFKAELGSLLYLPEVTAASIESNIIINNRFLTLLEIESEEMQSASSSLQNLAGAFSDTYSNEPNEISAILDELQTEPMQDEATQKRLARLTSLLQIPIQPVNAPKASPEAEAASLLPPTELPDHLDLSPDAVPELAVMAEAAAPVEMTEELKALAADPENEPLVTAYLNASAEARKLNLHSFLSPLPDGNHVELKSERKLRRVALSLIFQTDEIVETEMSEDSDPSADLEARIEKLFDLLGQMSDEVRDQIKAAAKYEQNGNYEVLLDVYNQLMTTRLRLQSSVVRRNTSEEVETVVAEPTKSKTKQEAAPDSESGTNKQTHQITTRKWLVFTVLFLLAAAIAANFMQGKAPQPPDDADVARLDRGQMPHGDFFSEVKIHQDLMLCMVTQNWVGLPPEEQKSKLQQVFAYGQERGAQRIMVMDPKGATLEFMVKEEPAAK